MSEKIEIDKGNEKTPKSANASLDIDFAAINGELTESDKSTENGALDDVAYRQYSTDGDSNQQQTELPEVSDYGIREHEKVEFYNLKPETQDNASLKRQATSDDYKPSQQNKTVDVASEQLDTGGRSPGELLREAREARNISQADIAKWLKLDIRLIEALEGDDDTILPETVFKVGYLRNYAKLVELSPETVIGKQQDYSKSNRFEPAKQRNGGANEFLHQLLDIIPGRFSNSLKDNDIKRAAFLSISIISFVALAWVTASVLRGNDQATSDHNLPQKTNQQGIPKDAESLHSTSLDMGKLDGNVNSNNTVVADDKVQEYIVKPLPIKPIGSDGQPLSITSETVSLTLNFNADSWIDIRDATGKMLIRRLGLAGSSKEVAGVAPFQVLIGYGPGVSIKYNGKDYDFSRYQGKRVARFTMTPPRSVE